MTGYWHSKIPVLHEHNLCGIQLSWWSFPRVLAEKIDHGKLMYRRLLESIVWFGACKNETSKQHTEPTLCHLHFLPSAWCSPWSQPSHSLLYEGLKSPQTTFHGESYAKVLCPQPLRTWKNIHSNESRSLCWSWRSRAFSGPTKVVMEFDIKALQDLP